MNHKRNLLIGALLTAATAAAVLTNVSAPGDVPATESAESVPQVNCAYQWDYQDAPELTVTFDNAVKEINPQADGRAQLFGERCGADFLVMETDLYVRLPAPDLTQTEDFGNFVAQVLEHVLNLPRESLPGPKDGFVEFTFAQNDAERVILRVPVQQYREQAQGKTGAELFELFAVPP